MRFPCTRKTLARVGCVLSGITALVGFTALFSNHWLKSETMHAGFLSGCYGGFCTSALSNIPGEYRTVYTVCVIMLVFMPLVLIIVSAILQAITVWKGPCKRRDLSGLVLAWLSGYHSLLLTILLIAAASMIPSPQDTDTRSQPEESWTSTTHTIINGEDVVIESGFQSASGSGGRFPSDFSLNVGWSAYFGLLAAILALASAVSSSLYFGMADNEENEDAIPLQSNDV